MCDDTTDPVGLLHHVEINVSHLQRSVDFWGPFLKKLGYQPSPVSKHGVAWKLGHTAVVLAQTKERYIDLTYHRRGTGMNHLAFYARDKAHVDELRAWLTAQGAVMLYQQDFPHAGGQDRYAVYFEDPDRIKVEVMAVQE